ncbi:hypothetical protein KUTeg_016433 [Tegillarca granosa]|uniref:Uncharacterized protein n=1 Tax=Tegillarca granosa TaxID=220873 RepID=A0ABQ9EKV0_TEGGR|nr:hypothetical protein KUTeg_016433 [Tegillarca granosa]
MFLKAYSMFQLHPNQDNTKPQYQYETKKNIPFKKYTQHIYYVIKIKSEIKIKLKTGMNVYKSTSYYIACTTTCSNVTDKETARIEHSAQQYQFRNRTTKFNNKKWPFLLAASWIKSIVFRLPVYLGYLVFSKIPVYIFYKDI